MNSLTKMFTGAAVLQLAAGGRMHVADAVEQYLGAFPPGKQGATIEQLASHTSGLIREGSDLAGESRAAFVRDVKLTPREAPPGAQYRYTNAGFSVLAAVIEQVTGASYEEYLRRKLFAPAGMRTAIFRDEIPPNDTRFAHGYVGTPAGLQPGPPNPYVWGTRGAGGVWSTVGDIYRWVVAVENGTMLGEAERRILFSRPAPPSLEAYGWHVDSTSDGRPFINKGGGSDDFSSQLLYYPRDSVTIVWASNNLRQRWRRTLNRTLADVMFGSTEMPLPAVSRVPSMVLRARAGRYVADSDTVEVRAGNGYLYVASNRLEVPTNIMFFPQRAEDYTGFDPATGKLTGLAFVAGKSLSIELSSGKRVVATRLP
jgi:CubicO group peptidase (beta-lactamase class C family)